MTSSSEGLELLVSFKRISTGRENIPPIAHLVIHLAQRQVGLLPLALHRACLPRQRPCHSKVLLIILWHGVLLGRSQAISRLVINFWEQDLQQFRILLGS